MTAEKFRSVGWNLFIAEDNFTVTDQLIIEPEAILEGGGLDSRTSGTAQQAHSSGRLKNIGGKGAAVDVEFNAEITGIGNPGNLIAVVEHDGLGDNTNKYGPFSHV